jgi:hypothetical protein
MGKKLICLISFVLILGLTPTNTASAELAGWWKLDEGSGITAYDSSGNGNDGTLQGDPQWVEGQLGGALEGDGDGDYILVPHSDTLDISDAVTVAMWVYGGIPPDQIICKGSGGGAWWASYSFRIDDNASYVRQINFRGRIGTNADALNSSSPIPQDEWTHIAITFDVSASGNNQKIYVNGQLDAESRSENPLSTNTDDLLIGADAYGATRWHWQGMLDDVRIFNEALPEGQIQAIMQGGGTAYPFAFRPSPADGAMHFDTWVNLGWRPGDSAVSHDVYIGENFDDVNDGAAETFQGNQTATFFVLGFPGFPYPDGLVPGTTYYWRIDEVNDTEPNSPWKGDVWSFMVPPKTAYFPDPADGAESIDPDVELSWTEGFGSKLHTVYFGDNFDDVNNAAGGLPQGATTYDPGTLKLAETYYWRVDEFDAIGTYKGDVWSFTTQGAVGSPDPANGAVDVKQTQIITWSPSVFAASHELYFGTDKDAVKNADTGSPEYKGTRALGDESYDPGMLEWDSTYYWRIDEVNNTNPDSPWTGILWSFTTADFLIVDDFESYNDIDPPDPGSNRIFEAWLDGYGIPTNGALVGNDLPPYAEQSIVHSGIQSMPYFYDNSVGYSEATLTLTYPRDWTEKGVNTLTIWFRGNSANAAETLYVALNGSAVVSHDNPDAAQITTWTEWTIDLQAFADQGVNLANVNTIAIGLGNRNNPVAGGSGTMYFDDIRLYPPPPEPAP